LVAYMLLRGETDLKRRPYDASSSHSFFMFLWAEGMRINVHRTSSALQKERALRQTTRQDVGLPNGRQIRSQTQSQKLINRCPRRLPFLSRELTAREKKGVTIGVHCQSRLCPTPCTSRRR
jgi:hypothetical protein